MVKLNDQNEIEKFLVFVVGGIYFGTPLLGVREIVKPQKYQKVPQAIDSCLGAINLRGDVMGVLDLNTTFGTTAEVENGNLLIFETQEGPIATLVDDVVSVSDIKTSDIETKPTIKSKVPMDYLIGIAKMNETLINLVDLSEVLSGDTLNKFQEGIKTAS